MMVMMGSVSGMNGSGGGDFLPGSPHWLKFLHAEILMVYEVRNGFGQRCPKTRWSVPELFGVIRTAIIVSGWFSPCISMVPEYTLGGS